MKDMNNSALVVIDLQNDITKNYRDIIRNVNRSIELAGEKEMHIIYIKHENLSPGTSSFRRGSRGFEFVSELKLASDNVFVKSKSSVLSCREFSDYISANGISDFYIAGADAVGCVKSACFNMRKAGFSVTVLEDCITSYAKDKLPEMLEYYKSKGCAVTSLESFSAV